MSSHKFWRLIFSENNGGDSISLSNITLTNRPHTLNLIANNTTFSNANARSEKVFEFSTPVDVGAYSFQAQGATAPKAWRFEFSDNGANWTTVHVEHAQTRWQTGENRHFVAELYSLELLVNGSNAAQSFNVFIHDLLGELIIKKSVQNGTTEILMPDQNAVSVNVSQECGDSWKAGRYYKSGALVIPINPQTTPFYYRNRHGGISDLIEPTWSTNPDVLTHDSSCVWEVVERFNQPITQFPIIPTRKL